jgi:hypothetical protein
MTDAEIDGDDSARFAELQQRAQAVGLTLARASQGFILVTKTHSRHTPDLETIAALLSAKVASK